MANSTMPAMPTDNPIILNLFDTYGAFLAGGMLSCVVWGISCMQLFLYYFNYERDPLSLKLFVAFVWLVDTANEILLLSAMWPVLITKWGSVAQLSVSPPTLVHHGWVAGIASFCVQMFFVYRIYRFSGNRKLFPIVIIPLALFQIIGTIPDDIWLFRSNDSSILSSTRVIALESSVRASSAFVDIVITVAMLYMLVQNRDSKFLGSKRMIFRLTILTVNSGLWTAVVAIINLSLILAFPTGLQFLVFEYPLSGLYVNSLLANLNARRFVREGDSNIHSYENETMGTSGMALRLRSGNTSKGNSAVTIHVDTSNVVDVDYIPDVPKLPASSAV
ncbi:hypothetical protein C8Q79DRAFT_974284 [Trametes meyenii]|nr:hypothetical protein C8Q79DRAFT_974284 [Trametes meyenii]